VRKYFAAIIYCRSDITITWLHNGSSVLVYEKIIPGNNFILIKEVDESTIGKYSCVISYLDRNNVLGVSHLHYNPLGMISPNLF